MTSMRKYVTLIESATNQRVRLIPDIYEDEDEVWDEDEALSVFIDESDLEKDFTVRELTPEMAKTLTTPRKDTTVWDAFQDFATEEQEELVKHKVESWDQDRIVVVMNKILIDGNHHVIAGIMANRPIKYIDLAE